MTVAGNVKQKEKDLLDESISIALKNQNVIRESRKERSEKKERIDAYIKDKVMNRNQSKDFLCLRKNEDNVKPRYIIEGEEVGFARFMRDINGLLKENQILSDKVSNRDKTIHSLKQIANKTEEMETENRAMANTIARVVRQRKEAERNLNRLQHNVYKFIATKLAELDGIDYFSLEEVDQHYWREFAALEMKWYMG